MSMHQDDYNVMSGAVFDGGLYRYSLWRFWNYQAARDGNARAVMFILGNPSTARAFRDDPTVVKCAHFAQRWGYDGMYIGNLFAVINAHWLPGKMTEEEAFGEKNDEWLQTMMNSSSLHVAAWGFIGGYHPERAKQVAAMFPELHHLGLSKDGVPKHPLYLPGSVEPTLWETEKVSV